MTKKNNKGKICITKDGVHRKYIYPEELSFYESQGYVHKTPGASWSEEAKLSYKNSFKENYGVENQFQRKEIKLKIKETCLDKYGVEYSGQAEKKKLKTKETLLSRTVNDWEEITKKIKETKNNRFGDENYNNIEKIEKTCLERYGVTSTTLLVGKSFYYKDGTYFDSSWELAVWIYCIDNNIEIEHEPTRFKYYVDGKLHYYVPDFCINGVYVDVKGSHLLDENLNLINPWDNNKIQVEKTKCLRDNNVILLLEDDIKPCLEYVCNVYGKDYLKIFKKGNNKGD